MKKFGSVCLFVLAAIWTLGALFKWYLGLTGYVDFNGRGSSAHFVSGLIQLVFAGGAYWAAQKLRTSRKATHGPIEPDKLGN